LFSVEMMTATRDEVAGLAAAAAGDGLHAASRKAASKGRQARRRVRREVFMGIKRKRGAGSDPGDHDAPPASLRREWSGTRRGISVNEGTSKDIHPESKAHTNRWHGW
jgi:hypothetical protein